MKEKVNISPEKITRPKQLGRYFLVFFLFLVVLLCGSYVFLALGASNQSLPRLTVFKNNVGSKTKLEIQYMVERIQKETETQNRSVKISVGDSNETKTFQELGIGIDSAETAEKIFNYGKLNRRFPSLQYLWKTTKGKIEISPAIRWSKNPFDAIADLASKVEIQSENPKIIASNTSYKIEEGKNGSVIDLNSLRNEIEKCFVENCGDAISTRMTAKKSNFNVNDLSPFNDQIAAIMNSKYRFYNGNTTIYPNMTQIANFIDLERTAISQSLTLSDIGIENYLKSTSGKFSQAAKAKKISTVDGTIIDQGRGGTQLDLAESIQKIKQAISNGQSSVELQVTSSQPKEEYVGPGYTLGRHPGKYIEVDLSTQTLYRIEGDQLLGTYIVSTGKWSMPTPTGEFTINNKDPRAYSREYDLYMPYWMAFIGSEYGIHELPEWANGTKEGEAHLGTPVSHGCIRLGRGSAEEVYNWADVGTAVIIHE